MSFRASVKNAHLCGTQDSVSYGLFCALAQSACMCAKGSALTEQPWKLVRASLLELLGLSMAGIIAEHFLGLSALVDNCAAEDCEESARRSFAHRGSAVSQNRGSTKVEQC